MSTKTLEQLRTMYPESHLHCDFTKAGQRSYRVVASLRDSESKQIASVEHYGSGNLDAVKEEAFNKLLAELNQKVANNS